MNEITATQVTETVAALTAKGLETMTAVGNGELSYFDEGIVEGAGIWGSCLAQEMGHKSSGVINRLRDLDLFRTTPAGEDDDSDWWYLTALGAAVARHLAEEEATSTQAPANVEVKRGPKWTYIFVNGEQVMEVRSHLADAVLASVNFQA